MILIGTVTINMTTDTGVFYCPVCEEETNYKLKNKRQFLTLYFIPLFPLKSEGRFVLCEKCRAQHEVDALLYNPEAEQKLALDVIRQALILLLVQCAQTTEDDLAELRQLMFDMFDDPTDEEQMMTELEVAVSQTQSYQRHLVQIAVQLPQDGKFLIIDGGVELLARDGILDELEQKSLVQMATHIGLSSHYANNSIQQAKQRLNLR